MENNIMKNFTENELQIINRFNTYKAWAKETLMNENHDLRVRAYRWPEYLEDDLCRYSERYASLVKIEAIIARPNFDTKLHAYGDRLQAKWYRLAVKLDDYINKTSCHWRREGFDSREDYNEYLWDHYVYDTDFGYDLSVVENLVADLYDKVLDEHYSLCY
jgi:hypothetical protein